MKIIHRAVFEKFSVFSRSTKLKQFKGELAKKETYFAIIDRLRSKSGNRREI